YRILVRRFPHTDEALAARAAVADIYHHKLGDLDAAIAEYQRLVTEFPDRRESIRPHLQVVHAYFELRNFDQARTEADNLIARWPNTPEAQQARFHIADSFHIEGRYAD